MNKNMPLIAVGIVAVLIIAGGTFLYSQQGNNQATPTPVATATDTPSDNSESDISVESGTYADGTYEVTGNYTSPGGPRSIEVSLTLEDGVVSQVEVTPTATDPTSKEKQEDFAANYEEEVVGKNIEDLELGKVSGSSLTPKGFNDALEQIREEASQAA